VETTVEAARQTLRSLNPSWCCTIADAFRLLVGWLAGVVGWLVGWLLLWRGCACQSGEWQSERESEREQVKGIRGADADWPLAAAVLAVCAGSVGGRWIC